MTDDKKISRLYQQGEKQGPSEQLDSAILKAAHSAVEAEHTSQTPIAGSPFSGGWRAVASIAAVLVITVILVPLVEQEAPVSSTVNVKSELMKEQDATSRQKVVQQPMQYPAMQAVQKNEKMKKRSQLNVQQSRSEAEQKHQQYKDSAGTDGYGKQAADEEATAPSSTAPVYSLVPVGSAMKSEQDDSTGTGSSSYSSPAAIRFSGELAEESETVTILDPDKWLEKIHYLADEGQFEKAQQELDKFKLSYPDEEIEPSLIRQIINR